MAMQDKMAMGADYSLWDNEVSTPQRVDFRQARAAGLSFVGIKASHGIFADRDFIYNWQVAKDAGVPRMAYHYLTWDRSMRQQMEFFCGLLAGDCGELPPVIDFESRVNAPDRMVASANLLTALEYVNHALSVIPMIYTSNGYWKDYGNNATQFMFYPLWIAHYGVESPMVPRPWSQWDFWQYTDRGPGEVYGSEAKMVDLNWYCGSEDELKERFKIGSPPLPPTVGVKQEWRARSRINIRSAPSTGAKVVGALAIGEVVNATDYVAANGYNWIQHDRGWSSIGKVSSMMMEVVNA